MNRRSIIAVMLLMSLSLAWSGAVLAADYRLDILGVSLDVPLRTVSMGGYALGTVEKPDKLAGLGFADVVAGDKVRIYNKDNNGHWQAVMVRTGQEKEVTLGYEEPDRCGGLFGCP